MQERYLRGEKFKFKYEDGSIKEGGDWYFFDSEKFFDAEVLHKADILDAFSAAAPAVSAINNTASINLPTFRGLVYYGPGICFTTGGTTYDMTEANRATLEAAVKADQPVSWSYSPALARKHGAGNPSAPGSSATPSATVTIRILDTHAQIIPDLSFSVQLK